MLFFGGEKNGEKPQKRSTLGFLFNPDLGSDIRPLRQSFGMFPRLLASIFAINGLFPRNHPAVLGDANASLTLGEVLGTAWANLSFTRQGLPKILLFFAVVGCVVSSVLLILTALLSALVPAAHAASIFDSPNGKCDLALKWIDYLFLKGDVALESDCGNEIISAPNVTSLRTALYSVLSIYSKAVLVFAGIIMLYHLLSMVAETAHYGVPMGKRANQIWGPIRLVLAIGLLVPVADSGLNSGQYIVIQMAKWGSGFASYTWSKLKEGIIAPEEDMDFLPPVTPDLNDVIAGILRMGACKYAANAILEGSGYTAAATPDFLVKVTKDNRKSFGFPVKTTEVYDIKSQNGYYTCGSVSVPLRPDTSNIPSSLKSMADSYWASYSDIINSVINKAVNSDSSPSKGVYMGLDRAYIDQGGGYELKYRGISVPEYDSADNKDFSEAVWKDIAALRNEQVNKLNQTLLTSYNNTKKAGSQIFSDSAKYGWVEAGAWFNVVARIQGSIMHGTSALVPKISAPDVKEKGWFTAPLTSISAKTVKSFKEDVERALLIFDQKILKQSAVNQPPPTTPITKQMQENGDISSGTDSSNSDTLANIISGVLKMYSWWSNGDGLSFSFGSTTNPLAEIAGIGHANLDAGFSLLLGALGANLASGVLGTAGEAATAAGTTTGAAVAVANPLAGGLITVIGLSTGWVLKTIAAVGPGIAAIVGFIGALLIMSGVTLAYVLPMMPFIKFFFNVLTWIVMVFEAIVSAPLFALAHVTPYGEGLPGDMAKKGYFFLLGILLRPALLVVGLVAGLLIFFIAINALNGLFNLAAAGSGAPAGSFAAVSKVIFLLMYTVLAYICANKSFQTISFFADHGLRWMSAEGPQPKDMGSKGEFDAVIGAASGFMGQQMSNAMGQIGSGAAKPLDSALAKKFGLPTPEEKMAAAFNRLRDRDRSDDNVILGSRGGGGTTAHGSGPSGGLSSGHGPQGGVSQQMPNVTGTDDDSSTPPAGGQDGGGTDGGSGRGSTVELASGGDTGLGEGGAPPANPGELREQARDAGKLAGEDAAKGVIDTAKPKNAAGEVDPNTGYPNRVYQPQNAAPTQLERLLGWLGMRKPPRGGGGGGNLT